MRGGHCAQQPPSAWTVVHMDRRPHPFYPFVLTLLLGLSDPQPSGHYVLLCRPVVLLSRCETRLRTHVCWRGCEGDGRTTNSSGVVDISERLGQVC